MLNLMLFDKVSNATTTWDEEEPLTFWHKDAASRLGDALRPGDRRHGDSPGHDITAALLPPQRSVAVATLRN